MDGSPEYLEYSDDDDVDEGDMETEEQIIIPDGWPSNWPKELIHHPVELGDRIIAAQALSTPPKVCPFAPCPFIPLFTLHSCLICLSQSFASLIHLPLSFMPRMPYLFAFPNYSHTDPAQAPKLYPLTRLSPLPILPICLCLICLFHSCLVPFHLHCHRFPKWSSINRIFKPSLEI